MFSYCVESRGGVEGGLALISRRNDGGYKLQKSGTELVS